MAAPAVANPSATTARAAAGQPTSLRRGPQTIATPPDRDQPLATHFAPAGRAAPHDLAAARAEFLANPLAVTLLEAIPDLAMVLNQQRQIIAVNRRLLVAVQAASPEDLLGVRPGELVGCVRAHDGPDGCGTGPACAVCGAVQAVVACLESRDAAVRECRLRALGAADGGALDVEVQATFLNLGGAERVVVALRDISGRKRRALLERVFFHDLLNLTSGVHSIAELLATGELEPETEDEFRRDLIHLADELHREILAQRQLLAAERGELQPEPSPNAVPEVLRAVCELYRHQPVAAGREVCIGEAPDCGIEADPALLMRVLGNLVKNALEAMPEGEAVRIAAEDRGDRVAFTVQNRGVIPRAIQDQIFQRSFSTKGESGRGVGTYSVKLLTERYLGGEVSFTSAEPEGTVFTVLLPKQAPRS